MKYVKWQILHLCEHIKWLYLNSKNSNLITLDCQGVHIYGQVEKKKVELAHQNQDFIIKPFL